MTILIAFTLYYAIGLEIIARSFHKPFYRHMDDFLAQFRKRMPDIDLMPYATFQRLGVFALVIAVLFWLPVVIWAIISAAMGR